MLEANAMLVFSHNIPFLYEPNRDTGLRIRYLAVRMFSRATVDLIGHLLRGFSDDSLFIERRMDTSATLADRLFRAYERRNSDRGARAYELSSIHRV